MLKTYSSILLMTLSISAHASDWREVSSSDLMTYYVDVSSVKFESPSIVKVWTKGIYAVNQKIPYTAKEYNSVVTLLKFNCAQNTNIAIRDVTYLDGTTVEQSTATNPQFSDIVPDSIGETTKNFVCQFKKK